MCSCSYHCHKNNIEGSTFIPTYSETVTIQTYKIIYTWWVYWTWSRRRVSALLDCAVPVAGNGRKGAVPRIHCGPVVFLAGCWGVNRGATGGEEKYKPIMDTPEERFSHSIAWSLDTEVDRPPLPYFQWFSDLLFPSFPFNYCKYFPEA